jgi:hypothetical protein
MKQVSKIHQQKTPNRRHYINEWLEIREMDAMDLLRELNEADTSLPAIDKSQVYRWLKGQLPQRHMQARIAGALSIVDVETGDPDPAGIFRDPNLDWFARQVKDRSEDELRRLRSIVENAFPPKTGTRN